MGLFGSHTRDPTRGWGGGESQMSKVVRFRIRERGIWHAGESGGNPGTGALGREGGTEVGKGFKEG